MKNYILSFLQFLIVLFSVIYSLYIITGSFDKTLAVFNIFGACTLVYYLIGIFIDKDFKN